MSSEDQVGSIFVELTLDDTKYKNSMDKVKDEANKSSSSVAGSLKGGMGTALTAISTGYMAASMMINQATNMIKSAMAEISEGAALNRSETQFRNYAASIGISADQMIADMKRVTGETVDDSDLIAKATTMMFKGLDNKEVVQVMKVAAGVARATGADIESSMAKIALAIETGMMRSLTRAGLVTKEEASMLTKYLSVAADKATVLAYLEAKQAIQLEKMGAGVTDMKKVLSQLGTAMKDIGDQISMGMAEGLEGLKPLLQDLTPLVNILGQVILDVTVYAFKALTAAIFVLVAAFTAVIVPIYKFLEAMANVASYSFEKLGMTEAAEDAKRMADAWGNAADSAANSAVKMYNAMSGGLDKSGKAGNKDAISAQEKEAARLKKLMEDKLSIGKKMQDQESITTAKASYEAAQRANIMDIYLAKAKYSGMKELEIAEYVFNETVKNNKLEYAEQVRAIKAKEAIALTSAKGSDRDAISGQTAAQLAAAKYDLMKKDEAALKVKEIAIIDSDANIKKEKLDQASWELGFEKSKNAQLNSIAQDQIYEEKAIRDDAKESAIESAKIIYEQKIKLANDNYNAQLEFLKKEIAIENEKATLSGKDYDEKQQLANKEKELMLNLQTEKYNITKEFRDTTLEEERANRAERESVEQQMYQELDGYAQEYYASITKSIQDQIKEYRNLGISEVLIQASTNKKLEKLMNDKAKNSEDFFAGMKAGAIELNDTTKMGAEGFSFMQDSIGSLADEFTTFVTTGKADFASLTQSILADLTKILIKKAIIAAIDAAISYAGSSSSGGGSTSSSSGGGGANSAPVITTLHAGGIVGRDGVISGTIDPSVFYHAPRLHGGLAADEYPAILQAGERVVPKGGSGGNMTVNVINNKSDTDIKTKKKETSKGMEIDVIVDNMVAKKLSQFGSNSNKAMRQGYGAQEQLVSR